MRRATIGAPPGGKDQLLPWLTNAVHELELASFEGTPEDVAAGFQPLDSDLTAIAALATTAYGRSLLTMADAAAARAALGTPTLGTLTTTGGTSIDVTGFPAGVKRLAISFWNVSTTGTSRPIIQLGSGGAVETSGYIGTNVDLTAGANVLTALSSGVIVGGALAANNMHGVCRFELISSGTATWAFESKMTNSTTTFMAVASGGKDLSAEFDRFRITTVGGTDTFDSLLIGYAYE